MQAYAGLAHAPVFSPAVVPAHRGMIVDVPLPLAAMGCAATIAAMRESLAAFYAGNGVVTCADGTPEELLLRQGAPASDAMVLLVTGSADASQARLIARLDNLGKGASGAAIQNLNIMCGLPETTGLRL
jgi:N-acetyl-gamma-glutamyl-phosphate reductase